MIGRGVMLRRPGGEGWGGGGVGTKRKREGVGSGAGREGDTASSHPHPSVLPGECIWLTKSYLFRQMNGWVRESVRCRGR